MLLLWPNGSPASGAWFWLWMIGAPNAVFLVLLGLRRAAYETEYLHALYYNQHWENRRHELIERGQQPLHVLAYSYRFPLEGQALAQTILDGPAVLRAQPLRDSSAVVRHTRLPDAEPDSGQVDPLLAKVLQQVPLTPHGNLYAHLLVPLVKVLRDLSQTGSGHLPKVRLVTDATSVTPDPLEPLRAVINACGLPSLDCEIAPASQGLMLADAWLDGGASRPVLLIAAQLRDVPPADSTEGGVAVLLARPSLQLPDSIGPCATLHRPVTADPGTMADGLATAVCWGKADADTVQHVWMTGFHADENRLLAGTFRDIGLAGLSSQEAKHLPDHALGHAGVAAGWLSVAAAVESGTDGPQLVMTRAENIQMAVLYAHKQPSHEYRTEQHAG
ncbi:hypothetical protein GCM10027419_45680 [Pandoraea terrae]